MPLKLMPMDEVCAALDEQWPDLEYEADRAWIWITNDIGPLHRKCSCEECERRAAIRKSIGREGIGFSFAPNGHACPSGAMSYWGHRCERPTRLKRRSKRVSELEPDNAQSKQRVSDEELLAMIS